MNHFLIVANGDRDTDLSVTMRISENLKKSGKDVLVHVTKADEKGNYSPITGIPEATECIIVLGGDGTFIGAARDVADKEIPMLGVNLGTLGFLTDVEVSAIEPALNALEDGSYTIEERMMLCGKAYAADGTLKGETRALNDIVLHTAGSLRVSDYNLYVNDALLGSYRADGMIVCTPTGSTAYSMSAGGPIIEPTARMMAITPICPHTLNSRSILLAAERKIRISVTGGRGESEVSFDGHNPIMLTDGDYVEVRPSTHVTRIVRIQRGSFLSVLSTKFQS